MSNRLPAEYGISTFPINTGQITTCQTPEYVLKYLKNPDNQAKIISDIAKTISEIEAQMLARHDYNGSSPNDEFFYFTRVKELDLACVPTDLVQQVLNGESINLKAFAVAIKLRVESTLGKAVDNNIILKAIKILQGSKVKGDIFDLLGLQKYKLGLIFPEDNGSQKSEWEQRILTQYSEYSILEELLKMLKCSKIKAPLEALLCLYHHMPKEIQEDEANQDFLNETLTQENFFNAFADSKNKGTPTKYLFHYFWNNIFVPNLPLDRVTLTKRHETRETIYDSPALYEIVNIEDILTKLNELKDELNALLNEDLQLESPKVEDSDIDTEDEDTPPIDVNGEKVINIDNLSFGLGAALSKSELSNPANNPQKELNVSRVKGEIVQLEQYIILWEMARTPGQIFGEKLSKYYQKIEEVFSPQQIKGLIHEASKTVGQQMGAFFYKNHEAEILFDDQQRVELYKSLAQTPGQHFGQYLAYKSKYKEHIKDIKAFLGEEEFDNILRVLMLTPGQKSGILLTEKLEYLKENYEDETILIWLGKACSSAGQESATMLSHHWNKLVAQPAKVRAFSDDQPLKMIRGVDKMIADTFEVMGQDAGKLLTKRWNELNQLNINLRELIKKAAECQSQSIAKFLETRRVSSA